MEKITKNDCLVDFLTSNKYTPEDRETYLHSTSDYQPGFLYPTKLSFDRNKINWQVKWWEIIASQFSVNELNMGLIQAVCETRVSRGIWQ